MAFVIVDDRLVVKLRRANAEHVVGVRRSEKKAIVLQEGLHQLVVFRRSFSDRGLLRIRVEAGRHLRERSIIDQLLMRWLRNFEQGAKWNVGLTAGMFCLRIRSEDEETSPPEPHAGLQGEGGPGCLEERSNDCATC